MLALGWGHQTQGNLRSLRSPRVGRKYSPSSGREVWSLRASLGRGEGGSGDTSPCSGHPGILWVTTALRGRPPHPQDLLPQPQAALLPSSSPKCAGVPAPRDSGWMCCWVCESSSEGKDGGPREMVPAVPLAEGWRDGGPGKGTVFSQVDRPLSSHTATRKTLRAGRVALGR